MILIVYTQVQAKQISKAKTLEHVNNEKLIYCKKNNKKTENNPPSGHQRSWHCPSIYIFQKENTDISVASSIVL